MIMQVQVNTHLYKEIISKGKRNEKKTKKIMGSIYITL